MPITLERKEPGYRAKGKKVFRSDTVVSVRKMLEQVATPNGTARKARIPRYRIGGKTGTTHKLIDGNYENKRYVSLFAGLGRSLILSLSLWFPLMIQGADFTMAVMLRLRYFPA